MIVNDRAKACKNHEDNSKLQEATRQITSQKGVKKKEKRRSNNIFMKFYINEGIGEAKTLGRDDGIS